MSEKDDNMNSKRSLCAVWAVGVVLLACPAGAEAKNLPAAAAYIEGTVTEVPMRASGRLDLSTRQALRFLCGKSSYDIPYERMTEVSLGRKRTGLGSGVAGGAAWVAGAVLPVFFPRNRYITIDFRIPESTNTQRMIFQVPEEVADYLVPVLEARAAKPGDGSRPPADGVVGSDDSWWGNRVWRTSRNQHLWPPAPATLKHEAPEHATKRQ